MKWERSCTDILCCLIFTAFLVVMVGLSGYALKNGDPKNILTPFDSVGNKCGAINQGIPANVTDYSEYKYKYFTNLTPSTVGSTTGIFNAVCVKECPKQGEVPACMPNKDSESCPTSYFDSVGKFGYCLPEKDDVQ